MEFGEIVFYIVITLIALYLIIRFTEKFILPSTNKDKEYFQKLKESLKEEYIITETGAKITLEEAESGHWIEHDNEYKVVTEEEIEKLKTEEEKIIERGLNYLKESKEYRKHNFSDKSIEILQNTEILSKYDDWGYSNCFSLEFANGFAFFPSVEYVDKTPGYFTNNYNESQIMFWVKLDFDLGHYYLREKSKTEKFFDLTKKNVDIKLKDYEIFTFRKTNNLIKLIKIIEKFENQKNIEIEFVDNNIFIKNLKLANLEEIKQIENLIKNVC